jgi:hypothetical protein
MELGKRRRKSYPQVFAKAASLHAGLFRQPMDTTCAQA